MLATGSQIGKYLLGTKLGQGGFGVVFRAHDASLDREVALKFLTQEASSSPQILQRFLQEARSAAKIQHPGIVTVYECGQLVEANNAAYIAMELLDGESLTDRLARSGRMPAEEAMEITRQVASALEAAHRANIVHRDLKPDNIFLVRDPAVINGERIKVLDFGIAKLGRTATSSVQTQSMQVFGTPRYMSPEQCKSAAQVDHRSDIYTLGVILFELVCGRAPFNGAPGELIAQHVLVDAPAPSQFAPDLPPELEALIVAMLAKEPDDRPATMAAIQRALELSGGITPGVAPTLLPGQLVSASYSRPRPPTRPGPVGSINPTTLGGAASSSVVRRRAASHKKHVLFALAGAGAAIAVSVVLVIMLRNTRDAKPDKPVVAAVEPPKPEAKPEPKPEPTIEPKLEPKLEPEKRPEPVKPTPLIVGARTVPKPAAPVVRRVETLPGSLSVSAKPACEVQIDDGATFHTPIRGFKLPTGRHKVTLVNTDLGINDSFFVEIKSGETESVMKDYSDRIPAVKKDKDRTIDPMKPKPPDKKDKTINPFAKQGSGSAS
ncbi:MAG: serine/threonine-protein kinase [Kofleriaceae bacterium]